MNDYLLELVFLGKINQMRRNLSTFDISILYFLIAKRTFFQRQKVERQKLCPFFLVCNKREMGLDFKTFLP